MREQIIKELGIFRGNRMEEKKTTRFIEILEKVFQSDFIDKSDVTPEGFIKFYQLQSSDQAQQSSKTILTLNEFEIQRVLKEISETAFPDKSIWYFKVNIVPQESKTKHGDYTYPTKEMRIYNLSRKTAHIIKTTIHELAHHCQNCFGEESGHSKRFYEIYKHLLETAHRIGYIDLSKTMDQIDSRDLEMLVKNCGKLNYLKQEKTDTFIVKVLNSFDYKNLLKDRGYSYSMTEKAWVREIDLDNKETEEIFLKEKCEKATFTFINHDEHTIDSVYYMLVGKNIPSGTDMKKEGFFLHERYGWVKKIPANQKEAEEKKSIQKYKIKPKFVGNL